MPEYTRVKPVLDTDEVDTTASGLDEFKSSRVTKEVDLPIAPGWSRKIRPRSSSTQIPRFTVPDDGEEVLIKFLDDMPFAPIFQHWLVTSEGRRAYTCAGFEDCPLCQRGDKPKASDWFNIVVLGMPAELKVWIASPDPSQAIEDMANGKRTSPINKDGLYFAVSKKKGSNGFFSYTLLPVKGSELAEDWPGYSPLNEIQIEAFNRLRFDSSAVRIHTNQELTEAARKHLDSD